MKEYARDLYRCPFSGEKLSLEKIETIRNDNISFAQNNKLNEYGIDLILASTVVKEGFLFSEAGGYWFPIINFTPIFLDFRIELHDVFLTKHRNKHPILQRLKVPDGEPRPGERFVQESFTREWETLELGSLSFGITGEQRDFFVSLELDWPDGIARRKALKVLEIGSGSGFESQSLHRVTGSMVFGFDLNLALLRNGHLLADEPFINNAVCSLYRLPIERGKWDIVYSSGCIHHTHSTQKAFEEILEFKTPDGLIYLWIYGREDADYSIASRKSWLREDYWRPKIATMPKGLQSLVVWILATWHFRAYKKTGGYNPKQWQYRDSEHFVRDRWTALYAHRQSFNEVIRWFLDKDMEYRLIDPKKYYEYFNWPLIGIGIRGLQRDRDGREAAEAEVPE